MELGPFEKEIKSEFNSLGIIVEDSVIVLCSAICKRNDVCPSDLLNTWIAFTQNNESDCLTPTEEILLLMETKEFSVKSGHNLNESLSFDSEMQENQIKLCKAKEEVDMSSAEIIEEPSSGLKSRNIKTSYKFPPEVIHSYGTKIQDTINTVPLNIKVEVSPDVTKDAFMFTKLTDEAEYLCDSTYDVIDAIKNNVKFPEDGEEENNSYFFGRVVQNSNSKLDPSCIILDNPETGHLTVDVSQLNDYSLFPGQVIVVKGVRSGTRIVASNIYDNGRLPLSNDKISFSGKIKLLIAAGPFVEDDEDNFQSLNYLAECSRHLEPQAIILLGPIINSETFPSVGPIGLRSIFKKAFQHLSLQIENNVKLYSVVNKSDRCWIPVYPTLPTNILLDNGSCVLPDPALLNVNGLSILLSSTDVILHLAKQEIQKNCQEKFLRLSDHCLKQQTVYPLYPSDTSIGIDYKLIKRYALLPHSPHFVFFRSVFKYFIKESDGKNVIVNPGSMSRKKDTKTFALLEVRGSDSNWNPSNSVSLQILKG